MRRSMAILALCLALTPRDCPAAAGPKPGAYHVAFQERQAYFWRNGLQASGSGDGSGYMLKLRSDTLRYEDSGARMCLQGAFSGWDYGGIVLDSCGFAPDNPRLRVLDANQSLSGEIDRFVWKLLPGAPSVSIARRPSRRPSAGKPAVDAQGRRIPIPKTGERLLPAYPRP